LLHEVTFKLADVCLKLGQNAEAISICSQLLKSDPSSRIKQKTLSILAIAYNRKKNYDKAVLTLSGRWNGFEAPSKEGMFPGSAVTDQSPTRTK